MKKWIALVMVLALALAMVPAVGLAEEKTIDVKDIITANDYIFEGNSKPYAVDSYFAASVNVSATTILFTQLFAEGTKIVNSEYNSGSGKYVCAINIHGDNYSLKNITFGEGVLLQLGTAGTNPITIEECTFDGPTWDGDTRYAITMGGGPLVLKGNTFNKVYRGVNFLPRGNFSLTATGNTFDLLLRASNPNDNVAIQLSGDGAPYPANRITADNNTFIGAQAGLRLHSSFQAASDIGSGTIITFQNNTLINTPRGVGLHPSVSGTTKTAHEAILANNVTETGTITATEEGTEVKAEVEPTFTIIIPAAVDFGKLTPGTGTAQQNFPVKAEGLFIEDGKQINVSLKTLLPMKAGVVALPYTLENSAAQVSAGNEFTSFTANRTENGFVKVNRSLITKAGAYRGTMTFTIAYVPVP